MKTATIEKNQDLLELCSMVRELVTSGEYDKSADIVCHAMGEHPDAPEPHNLLGIILEKMGEHSKAMKHFRAARELDPTYRPASQNLCNYGTFYSSGVSAYDDSDC